MVQILQQDPDDLNDGEDQGAERQRSRVIPTTPQRGVKTAASMSQIDSKHNKDQARTRRTNRFKRICSFQECFQVASGPDLLHTSD